MELILCPVAVILALISLFRKRPFWGISSYFCCALSMALSLFDINKRITAGDISGIMDIYPTVANIYIIILAFVTLMNVLAVVRKNKGR